MGLDNALYKFKLLTGFDDAQAEKWIPIIKDAISYVKSMVDTNRLTEEQISAVEKSAGVYAFYQYIAGVESRESSFSAGDVRVSYNNSRVGYAKSLWESELCRLKSMGDNSDFLFKRV